MNAKMLMKIGLFGGGVIAGNIDNTFAWTCSEDHDHEGTEVCLDTGDRCCNMCKKGFHPRWEACRYVVGDPQKGRYVIVPLNTPDSKLDALWKGIGDTSAGEETELLEAKRVWEQWHRERDEAICKRLQQYGEEEKDVTEVQIAMMKEEEEYYRNKCMREYREKRLKKVGQKGTKNTKSKRKSITEISTSGSIERAGQKGTENTKSKK